MTVYRKHVQFAGVIIMGIGMISLISGMVWTLVAAVAKAIAG